MVHQMMKLLLVYCATTRNSDPVNHCLKLLALALTAHCCCTAAAAAVAVAAVVAAVAVAAAVAELLVQC
jgi:hypothetical protein